MSNLLIPQNLAVWAGHFSGNLSKNNPEGLYGRATSFNLSEQCVVKEIVAEGGPEHFPPGAESFFRHSGFS
jgi:hypothetical protein